MIITIKNGVNNTSLQIGDTIYFIPGSTILQAGGLGYSNDISFNSSYVVGVLSSFTGSTITIDNVINSPSVDDFIMFSKDKNANNTSLIGYYAEVKLKNNRTDAADLFSLSSEITQSSK